MSRVDYKDKSIVELKASLVDLKKKLCKMRFDIRSKVLTDTSLIRKLKTNIARVKTFMKLKIKEVKTTNV